MNNADQEKTLRYVTHEQLDALLRRTRPQPVTIVTRTPARILKRGHDFGDVIKIAFRHVWIGVRYENLVNNQRAREGRPLNPDGSIPLFWSQRLWAGAGARVPGNCHLRRHRKSNRLYLAFWPLRILNELYQGTNGKRLTLRQIQPLLRGDARPEASRRGPDRNQGVRKGIQWRCVALDHLEAIRIAGQQHLVLHPAESPVPIA